MITRIIVYIVRILVGVMFIFSGFVKLIDPIGSQYKFQEYFSESVLDIEFLLPYTLVFSIVLIILEILLGVLLLLGYKRKVTVWSLLILSTFFLFLTWYSAFYDKVTDCGCFGDAIKLTPWETFYKNIILIVLIAFLLIRIKDIKLIFSKRISKIITYLSFGGFMYITYYVLSHLPIIDFRPYAVGNNIIEGMKYKEDGEIPPIHDFFLESADKDLTNYILSKEKVMLIIVYRLDKSDTNGFKSIKELTQKALENGYTIYGVSSSFEDDLASVKEKYKLPFYFLFCDEITLKTMIRSNPGIMTLEKGTITGKWNWTDADKVKLQQ